MREGLRSKVSGLSFACMRGIERVGYSKRT
jgi:hypothetical protein